MAVFVPPQIDVQTSSELDRRKEVKTPTQPETKKEGREAFVLVLANHKGGVTKTTSTANLGVMLAEAGRKVLLVDCDPQANLSEAFGWTEEVPGERLEDLLHHPAAMGRYSPPAAIRGEAAADLDWSERLSIVPCTGALADVIADLAAESNATHQNRLSDVLRPLTARFDLILIDTPPGRGDLSGMALTAADGLIIPALAADLDVHGAGKLYDLIEEELPDVRILGVLIAGSDRRWRVTRDAATRMEQDHMRVLPVQIPRAVRVASAPRYGLPTGVLEPDASVSYSYRKLARWLLAEIDR